MQLLLAHLRIRRKVMGLIREANVVISAFMAGKSLPDYVTWQNGGR